MHWNEKIDLLKKYYPAQEFSVPHIDRKGILRQIETQFISRPEEYYYSNDFNGTFCNWWENSQSTLDLTIESNPYQFLNAVIDPNKPFWIACEFTGWIPIYKAKVKAILDLIAIGQTWTGTFHIIQLKCEYMISLRLEEAGTRIKVTGSKKIEDKIKQATTPR